ncbi:MAG: AsmA family protein [Deltaproteobacteria bacterium]|nr:AsmA family protein [Deltaproteobacteria bacterium]
MRWKWIIGSVFIIVVALMATIYAVLSSYDYNKLKPRLAQLVMDTTGRELSLGGEVDLAIGFSPALVVTEVSLANASWGSRPKMITVDKLEAQLRLLPLLFREIQLKRIGLAGVDVFLETDLNGQGNWDVITGGRSAGKASVLKPRDIEIDALRIEKARFTYREGKTGSTKQFTLTGLDLARKATDDELALDLKAQYNGQPVTLSGKTGLMGTLFAHRRFPLELSGTFSKAKVEIAGAIDDVLDLQGIVLKAHASGTDLAALEIDKNIPLPETSVFDVTALLKGSRESLALKDINGDLSGSGVNLAFSGNVGNVIVFSGVDLHLKGSGKDLSQVGALIEAKLPATDEFAIEGHLTGAGKALSLADTQGSARRGSLRFTVNGAVQDFFSLGGLDLQSSLTGKDLTGFGDIIGAKLPETDQFEIQGRLTGSTDVLALQAAKVSAGRGSLRLSLAGAVKDLLTLKGMDLQSSLTGKDLTEFGDMIGVKLPKTDQFEIQGRLTGSTDVLALQAAKVSAGRGSLRLSLAGAVKDLLTFKGIDLQTRLSGKELADLGPFVGVALPELGPFDVKTQLTGSANTLAFNALAANIDKSDFKGLAKVTWHQKPAITLRLDSSLVDFTALMKSFEKDAPTPADKAKQKQSLFSKDPLPFDVLQTVNADIVMKAENIQAKNARFKFGLLTLKLVDGSFRIDKLEGTYKDTKFSGHGHITHGTPTLIATKFIVQDFDLGSFLKETGVNDEVRSHVDIAADLESRGNSVQSLAAHLDGSIGAVMGQGYLTKYLNMLSVNLTQKVLSFWDWARRRPDQAEQINCAVVQFDIKEGVATSQAFVFDSQLAILTGQGEINLASEQIDFLLVPDAKDPSLLSLSTNLRVSGPLLDPEVRPDKTSLLTQGAWALSSLAIGPLGLLAPFVHLGAHKAHPCDVKGIGQSALRMPAAE